MSSKRYNMTLQAVMKWADSELSHVGYLAGVEDPDIQYAYAQSVVNGMVHLRDALYELANDPEYAMHATDILKQHDLVVRVIKHLLKDYGVRLQEIKAFNTHHVLGNLSYLSSAKKNRTRRNRQ